MSTSRSGIHRPTSVDGERRGGVTAKNHVNFLSGEREAVKNAEFSNGISCVTNEIPETSSPMVHEDYKSSERDCSTSAARNIKLMPFERMLGETRTELIANIITY